LLVGVSIAATTLIISTIATQIQERELRLQVNTIGVAIVHGLSSVARDNLLLKSYPIIQEYVRNVARNRITGMEQLYVINREGIIVADIQPDSVNRQVSIADFSTMTSTDSTSIYETSDRIRFIQAIHFQQSSGRKKIFLGSCSASFSKAELFASIEEMKSKILFVSFAVSVLAIGLVYFASKKIVHIIIVLSEAAKRVGTGDLKVSVVTRFKDELGMLASEFNLMVVQIREKTEMQKFVSSSTMEMIEAGEEAKLGGTRQPITAMFTDIRGFTSFSEKHSPEAVVEILNLYLDVQTQIISNHRGVIDKFLGDGIMSVFTGEKQTHNAVAAAIHIQSELAKMNQRRKTWKDNVLEVGIGISAGDAVLGSIGSQDRMDYTAIGDTVNLASRICGVAAAGQIMVTEEVVQKLDKSYKPQSEGKLPIKGKQNQVPVYRIPYQIA
jgi:class 3 adenylate cyclase